MRYRAGNSTIVLQTDLSFVVGTLSALSLPHFFEKLRARNRALKVALVRYKIRKGVRSPRGDARGAREFECCSMEKNMSPIHKKRRNLLEIEFGCKEKCFDMHRLPVESIALERRHASSARLLPHLECKKSEDS